MPAAAADVAHYHRAFTTPVRHIVVIVQENRSMDNLFNGYPGADTVLIDPYTGTMLEPLPLENSCDPGHEHPDFVAQFDGGAMDGFQKAPCSAYSFVPHSETNRYFNLVNRDGVLGDETFQSNQGESFPAHQYLYAGRSCSYPSDYYCMSGAVNGGAYCGERRASVPEMNMHSRYPGNETHLGRPCKAYTNTILDEATAAQLGWRYYTFTDGWIWAGPTADAKCWGSKRCRANIIVPSAQVLSDIATHQLANLVFVTPSIADSDHPGSTANGPAWVASIVDAIGKDSEYWSSTTILIVWDDWGGWYDHVVPPPAPWNGDPDEYGFRVPLVVVSPYVRPGSVDHTTRNVYGSILRYVETTFGLGSLQQVDAPALTDDLGQLFDYAQPAHSFLPV